MCVPICTDTRVHTRHTAVRPDLHPTMLASTGKEQMDRLGLARMDTQGSQICLFDAESPKQNKPSQGEFLGGGGGAGNWDKSWGEALGSTGLKGIQRAGTDPKGM